MSSGAASFVGSVPENYDRYMGPVFFDSYAADLVARAKPDLKGSVLELACGTGRLTAPLLAALPKDARLTATDLNPPMIDYARGRVPADPRLTFEPADAMALPYPEHSFDAALCQFGVMFFPDKRVAHAGLRRVLKPGAHYHFNVWAPLAENAPTLAAHEVFSEMWPNDPPLFYMVPFGYGDPALVRADLEAAGFGDVTITPVESTAQAASARDVATGLVRGTPAFGYIAERGPGLHDEAIAKLTERLIAKFGDSPCRVPRKAFAIRAVA